MCGPHMSHTCRKGCTCGLYVPGQQKQGGGRTSHMFARVCGLLRGAGLCECRGKLGWVCTEYTRHGDVKVFIGCLLVWVSFLVSEHILIHTNYVYTYDDVWRNRKLIYSTWYMCVLNVWQKRYDSSLCIRLDSSKLILIQNFNEIALWK